MDPIKPEFEPYMVKKKVDFEEDEDDIEVEEATKLEGKVKVCTVIKPRVDEEDIMKLANRRKKKQFFFFGKSTETISSMKMKLLPVYLTTVQVGGMGLFKNKTHEFNLIFDASTGKVLKYNKRDLRAQQGYEKLLELKPNELTVLKTLIKEGETTAEELALRLKFTSSAVKSILNKMMKQHIVGVEKIEKKNRWRPMINLPYVNPEKLHSPDLEIIEAELVAEPEKEKIKPKKIAAFVENFFPNTTVIEMARIYYPVFEVKLTNDEGTRILFVSALSGEEL